MYMHAITCMLVAMHCLQTRVYYLCTCHSHIDILGIDNEHYSSIVHMFERSSIMIDIIVNECIYFLKQKMNHRGCLTRSPRTQPPPLNPTTRPTQSAPSASHSSANSTSLPGSNSRSQCVETSFISPAASISGAQTTVSDTSMPLELRPRGNDTKGFAMNDAPPAYNECLHLPLYEIGSLSFYNEVSGSYPAYKDDGTPYTVS